MRFGILGNLVCQNRQTRLLSITLDCCIDAMASFFHVFYLFAALWPSLFLAGVEAVDCPHCHGNLASCTFTSDGKCPCVVDVAANAKVISDGIGKLTLTNLIENRFMKMFHRASLNSMVSMANRDQPGKPFELTTSTKVATITTALFSGQVTYDVVMTLLTELFDLAADDDERNLVQSKVKIIESTMKNHNNDGLGSSVSDTGVFTFIWGRVSEFVMKRDMEIRLMVPSDGASSSTSHATSFAAKLWRPLSFTDFSEMMNLYVMMLHALGLASVLLVTQFYERAIHDVIRRMKETWQVAHELLVLTLRRIEDSAGKLHFGNVVNECYLDALLLEARENAAVFFRTRVGEAQDEVPSNPSTALVKWNGKVAANAKKCCITFNLGRDHTNTNILDANGFCRFRHVCNQWVSDKGKYGRCLGDHPAKDSSGKVICKNPKWCDDPVTA